MKRANGSGCIKKLSGKRRNPYAVLKTIGTDKDGKQIQKALAYFRTAKEAQKYLDGLNVKNIDVSKANITFEEVFENYIIKDLKLKSKSSYAAYLQAYKRASAIHKMKLTDIRILHLQNVIDSYAEMAKSTQNHILVVFHFIFDYALKNDIVAKDYSKYVTVRDTKPVKHKIPFTVEEVADIWTNYDDFNKSVLFLLYSGLRIQEFLNLKSADVHLDEKYIEVHGTKNVHSDRILPIHDKMLPIVEEWLNMGNECLFTLNEEKVTYFTYRKFFDQRHKTHTPHDCRHTFTTHAHACGMDDIYLKKILGHSANSITYDLYTHVVIERLVEEINKLEYEKTS